MLGCAVLEIRIRNWSAIFLKIGYSSYRLMFSHCSIENVQEIWLTTIDFGQPNAENGRKMANGRLLLLAMIVQRK